MKLATLRKTETKDWQATDPSALANTVPALLTGRRDLSKLRYDFPLILVDSPVALDQEFIHTLTSVINQILQEIAPKGAAGEPLRNHVLRLEQRIRELVLQGGGGSLSELWDLAANELLADIDDDDGGLLEQSLEAARDALSLEGKVIDCDAATPSEVLHLAWSVIRRARADAFQFKVKRLIVRLADILHADFHKSDAALTPDHLKRSIGTGYDTVFDFEEMSRILASGATNDSLTESRRERIQSALKVLESQKFFAMTEIDEAETFAYEFDNCTEAVQAFKKRLLAMQALIKAIAIADLEIANTYKESIHDSYFSLFDEVPLSAKDLAMFPPYLVCLWEGHLNDTEISEMLGILASQIPVKILFQTNTVLPSPTDYQGPFSTGINRAQLATMALGINDAYVMQLGNADIYRLRKQIVGGLNFDGPTLFNIFAGSSSTARVSPYLMSAVATESRAFPGFTFNPAAGPDWASRFRIDDNPQADKPWPVHHLEYEDYDLQRISENVTFTLADFAACDNRYASYFEKLPQGDCRDDLVSLAVFLEGENGSSQGGVPYVSMVDESNTLHQMLVTDWLVQAARKCAGTWHSLQELGGIGNSHAENLLNREREIWQQEKPEISIAAPDLSEEPVIKEPEIKEDVPIAEAMSEPTEAELAETSSDDPYIETPRCTTCNECTEINNRMFAYNDNMQAYIADPDAGTFKELVEAAESCQVCIIHPGQPRNPDEVDLPELLVRAEAFAPQV